ncbi:endonuclease/exonuclease/phosphatase family protein [Novosphingobium album (ex Liu et al. 2023)]|uniref:Endonuclease/exonuclease/phosphatase family protein n=1 Tax=Novosphingobium album (ex Liu et al. 2023) TaxID=3031130 RepID=A0ABT5WLJ2_9SPHN|nr:endonuclease/exonuclease/phosphatase family protein [Novosphingobium album (ex Liu et al. 2023)]MDE8650900.1 endonuclease/exonuclease/phosphatase family protein [Novosphingobium album (ex Liu et al. 2023)]
MRLPRLYRFRSLLGLVVLAGGTSFAEPIATPASLIPVDARPTPEGDFAVLTYNVKGLPWPIARQRGPALRKIAARLAQLRREGRQPGVVVLQEAFRDEAKQIGAIAGYPYYVEGPYTAPAPAAADMPGREWSLGETGPAWIDSGLVVLSDYPVRAVARAPFPAGACAGYDCLAAKGVVLVTLDVPGIGPVAVATTHLNCRKASGAPRARTEAAYARQAAFLRDYLGRTRDRGVPVIVAGDFNQGQRPFRIASLRDALRQLNGGVPVRDALSQEAPIAGQDVTRGADAAWIRQRARDLQFSLPGTRARLVPSDIEIPFGTEPDGTMLSDHMGYTVHYRLRPLAS